MIIQQQIPYDVHAPRPLPGIAPLAAEPWFLVDDAYAKQMALRRDLIANRQAEVIQTDRPSEAATREMFADILANLPPGFAIEDGTVRCPDGQCVALDADAPFETLGRILQEDICLLEKRGDEHVLTGAVLCFPASWRLREKIGHPLTHIHEPVSDYTPEIAKRVQRLFDGVRAGRPIWRFNALWYEDPTLFQPRSASETRPLTEAGHTPYLRSERQVIWRLPKSNAVLFTIHTFVVKSPGSVTL